MMKTVLFLGGWHSTTMWFFKIHGGKGKYRLWIGDTWDRSACRFSKYCDKFFLLPHYSREEEYTDKLIEIFKKHPFDALIPIPHDEIILTSKYRDKLQSAGVPLVITDYDTLKITVDKEKLGIFCKAHSIPYPDTCPADKYNGNQILDKIGLPLIIKLKASCNQVDQKICYTDEDFLPYFELICEKHGEENVIVQQFIKGYELDSMFTTGVFCDYDHNIVGIYPTKKIRARPYSGGDGICTKTIRNIEVEDICRKTVQALGNWQAICNIELKRDYETGKYYLIEINPRPWGSAMFSLTLGGIDLIDWWIHLTIGQDMPGDINEYEVGAYSTEIFNDFLLLTDLFKDLPFKQKRQKAWESLLSYKHPYFFNGNGVTLYQSISDLDFRDLQVFWKKTLRLKKRLFTALKPSNKGRKEGEFALKNNNAQ